MSQSPCTARRSASAYFAPEIQRGWRVDGLSSLRAAPCCFFLSIREMIWIFSIFSNLIFTEIEKYVFCICNWIYNFVSQKIWKFFKSLDLRMDRFKKLKQKRLIIKYLFDILIAKISDRLTELISGYVAHAITDSSFFQNYPSEWIYVTVRYEIADATREVKTCLR